MGWFDDFTGASAEDALNQGYAESQNALSQGRRQGNRFYNRAASAYNPYVESGAKGQNALLNSLGLNGPEGSQAAYDAYMSVPAMQAANNYGLDSLAKKYNASPVGGTGGAANLAMARAGVENWRNYTNQLMGLGQQGLQATSAQSGVRQGQGDMAYGYGATRAAMAQQQGNALAANSLTGINNLLNVAGTGIAGYSAMYPKGIGK